MCKSEKAIPHIIPKIEAYKIIFKKSGVILRPKKEIKNLIKNAAKAEKVDDFTKALEIYHNASIIASDYELTNLVDDINDLVRKATIHESEHKMDDYEEKAKKAEKIAKYKEAARLYQLASDTASQIFKLGRTDMTKEVKRLTNKSRECEKLGE